MTERTHNFTGKSDFFDWCNMHYTPETIIEKAKIYLGDAEIKKDKPEDLIPYFTHLVAAAACNSEGQTIHLSPLSWITEEEREHLAIKIYSVIKAACKAKKEKVPFTFEYLKQQKYYYSDFEPIYHKIIDIISKDSSIIKIHLSPEYREALWFIEEYLIPRKFSNIHDRMHNRMREDFVKYAGENGYLTFSWNYEESKTEKETKGKFHPVIGNMCWAISEFNQMVKEYGSGRR